MMEAIRFINSVVPRWGQPPSPWLMLLWIGMLRCVGGSMSKRLYMARNFKALKVWFSLKTHGTLKYGRLIEQNIEQAQYMAALIKRNPRLELLAPVELNVVCFRYNPGLSDESEIDRMNEEILIRIQESGVAVPSGTRVSGRFAIRVAVSNHRSTRADFRLLANQVLNLGSDLQEEDKIGVH